MKEVKIIIVILFFLLGVSVAMGLFIEPYMIAEAGQIKHTSVIEEEYIEPTDSVFEAIIDRYLVTAYCSCYQCCGKTDGITASGVKAIEGVTVAADISELPFGTELYIDGIGRRIVQDVGGAIQGNRIDLYFDSHYEALAFGRQYKDVTIYIN